MASNETSRTGDGEGGGRGPAALLDHAKDALHEQQEAYAHGEDRPLGAYLRIMATYTTVVGGLSLLARRRKRKLPPRMEPYDIAVIALATQRVSRLIAKDSVTSPLRAPVTRYEGVAGPAQLKEQVRGSGVRKAVGELVTCPFCLSQWTATALSFGLVFAPRATRLVAGGLAAISLSDFAQLARTWAERQASR